MIFPISKGGSISPWHPGDWAPCCLGIPMSMNSGQETTADLPDAEDSELDTGPLQDSQDAIDEGREAAREALKDTLPDADEQTDGQSEQETESPEPEG